MARSPKNLGMAAAVSLPFLLAAATPAQDTAAWPQWRGPDRDGISNETDWLLTEEAPVRWSRNVGLGYSCVSIAGGRLFTIGHDKAAQEDTVFCVDTATGEDVWSYTFPAPTMAKFHTGGSLTTPSIDGDRLWVSSRQGLLFCLERDSGELRWRRDLRDELDLKLPSWGFAASPLVLDDMVVMNVGRVLAFDREGERRWKSDRDYGDCYSTPVDFEHGDRSLLAVFNAAGLAILDRSDGAEVARSEWRTQYDVNAASPVVIGDRIFISSGYNRGCSMLRFDGESLETSWTNKRMRTQMAGCVAFEGHLYGFDEGTLKCLSLDGEELWAQRGFGKGAFLLADGKLVILGNRGELAIAEATSEAYTELVRRDVLRGDARQWTPPVLCDGQLYCRSSSGDLVCLDVRVGGN